MLVGDQDILLPTTMVGNYPNPRWYDGHAFATLPKGEFIHDSISKEAFEDVVGAIVRDQEAAGLDVISDGKVYGGDSPYGTILYYYLERVSGYRLSGPPIGLPIYSTLYSPTCIGEVRREVPFHLVNLRAVRKATKKPVKVSYTGLGVIAAATTICTTRTPGNSPWRWPGRSTKTSRNSRTTAATSSSSMSSSGRTGWATGRSRRSTPRWRA